MKPALFLIIILAVASELCLAQEDYPAPVYPLPSQQQLAWHEMEMNAFVHFTINTFTNLEWGFGNESPALFNPMQADPSQWISLFRKTGFRGVILTCKHHDGFCLWPSEFTKHAIHYSPYKNGKGDLVKEVSEACLRDGLKFGVYLSPWDRNHADYGSQAYIAYYRNQLKELFTNYGPVFEMWFDGANGGTGYYGGANENRNIDGRTYYEWPKTLNLIHTLQPDVVFFSDAGPGVRWVGNEKGIAGETNWCMINPDTLYAGKPGIEKLLSEGSIDGTRWIPAEADVSIRPGWFYHEKENSLVKSPADLFEIYLNTVGRNAVLLLNIPPDRRGLINEADIRALEGFRSLLNGAFKTDLALLAEISAGSYRNDDKQFGPEKLTDKNRDSFWATDDTVKAEYIEIRWPDRKSVQYLVLQEYIRLGQRIKEFEIYAYNDDHWVPVASATTIGYKRIIPLHGIETAALRIQITGSRACPVLSNIEVY